MPMFSTENTVVRLLEESREPRIKKFDRVCLLMEALVYAVMGSMNEPEITEEDLEDAGYRPRIPAAEEATALSDDWFGDELLVPAPRVYDLTGDGVILEEWLRHRRGDNVWVEVVSDFYTRAASDIEVASYFWRTDMPRLQRHFVAALRIVVGKGLTRETLRSMGSAHAQISNRNGEPITSAVYDKVIGSLAAVLTEYGVPSATVAEVVPIATALKKVIVTTVEQPA